MANMDQSFLLELDANLSPTILIKQLMLRLDGYKISKAARPLRLSDPVEVGEGEEGGEGGEGGEPSGFLDVGDIEEAMTTLQVKHRLAAKFKWRRSKCHYYCPVSLKDGRIVQGRQEYAASFLDKIYLMVDELALKAFLKNPRPYLKLPQPRAPCKLSVLGSRYTGKTTLAALLAKKYNARVIDMAMLMQPRLKQAREEMLERTKQEATHAAIENIKTKFKEKVEAEKSEYQNRLSIIMRSQINILLEKKNLFLLWAMMVIFGFFVCELISFWWFRGHRFGQKLQLLIDLHNFEFRIIELVIAYIFHNQKYPKSLKKLKKDFYTSMQLNDRKSDRKEKTHKNCKNQKTRFLFRVSRPEFCSKSKKNIFFEFNTIKLPRKSSF